MTDMTEITEIIDRYCRHIVSVLPECDTADYPPELFRRFAEHGAMLRQEWAWCVELPEEMFLGWVLCPRVNNEELSDCRGLFHEQLAPRVKGLSLPEAILEVNRWCAENVTYRSTDIRTASAMAVYKSGCGRCGEESMFAVNAMRSVGIAARQVYAPWWSHCDDNHAWVEAFDGREWRFLGACEPEPRLDMGWFIPAAGRAMLCHTKCFVGRDGSWERLLPGEDPLDIDVREGIAYLSVTERYGRAREFTVRVTDNSGAGIPGAIVEYYVLNEGLLRKIARRVTDGGGNARMRLGLGSVWVTARHGGMLREQLVNTGETGMVELSLPGTDMTGHYDFLPPKDSGVRSGGLSSQERLQRKQERERAKELRESLHPGGGTAPEKPELWPWERFSPGEIPELWQDGGAHGLDERRECGITLLRGEGKGALGLMAWQDGWEAVGALRFGREIRLPEGRYRLITSYRLPDGTQLGDFQDFTLDGGESRELTASFREGTPEQLLQKLPLPELAFDWKGLALLCWIDPGAEPTEHLLGELKAAGRFPCGVHFIGRELDGDILPEGSVTHSWDEYVAETVARRVFLEPGNLPLVVLADSEGFARFASAGYNVGSVELAAGLCPMITEQKSR
ncbi:transglutaminase domain-containing protein [Acutalibacter sp. 1XD8-36]|uniref:transglutaminase domain-containing protein n=1 Tax=Acutalibacter sp. 1XD8-36 TaxID=2320852 RepID=UPI00260CE81A|nr:transglutaminase domain-containing protein [Acutalibacter sp. 1XD8-36]